MAEICPIETRLGVICGRDSIYLDEVTYDYAHRKVRLSGEINGALCSSSNDDSIIKYKLEFLGIYVFKLAELDLWCELTDIDFCITSFGEIKNSALSAQASKVEGANLKHYLIQTYDDVFEIVCKEYKFELPE